MIFLEEISLAFIDDEDDKDDKPYIWVIVGMLAVLSTILLAILLVK